MIKSCCKLGFIAFLIIGYATQIQAEQKEAQPLASPRCDYGQPHADAPPEMKQFGFLIGDYTVSAHIWTQTGWSPPRPGTPARWNGWYGLGGMTIVDEWYSRDPGIDPSTGRGVNVRLFDSDKSEWKMMWIETSARQVQDLRAKMIDGKLTMWQVYPDRPNFKAVFEATDKDNWHRIHYKKNDDGEWVPAYKLAAKRIPCPPSGK